MKHGWSVVLVDNHEHLFKFKFLQSHINKSLHQKGIFKLWSDGSLASVQRTLGWWGSVGWVGPKSKPIIRDLGR